MSKPPIHSRPKTVAVDFVRLSYLPVHLWENLTNTHMRIPQLVLLLVLLFNFLTSLAHALVDGDFDGMSDLWETQHEFSPFDDGTITPSQAPAADPDGDGQSNLQESIAATNPKSATGPLGSFKTTLTANPAQPGSFNLQFPQFIGKEYQLQSSTDLQTWFPVGEPLLGTSIPITLTTPAPSASYKKRSFAFLSKTPISILILSLVMRRAKFAPIQITQIAMVTEQATKPNMRMAVIHAAPQITESHHQLPPANSPRPSSYRCAFLPQSSREIPMARSVPMAISLRHTISMFTRNIRLRE